MGIDKMTGQQDNYFTVPPYGEFGGGSGGGARTPLTAKTDLVSTQAAWMLLAISEGEIDSITDVFFDNKNIKNFSHGVAYTTGKQAQLPIAGFSDVPSTNSVGVELRYNVMDTVLTVSPSSDYVEVTFILSQLETINQTNGDRLQSSIAIHLTSSSSGTARMPPTSPPTDGDVVGTGKAGRTTEPYAWTVRVNAPPSKPVNWYVHIRRTSPDSTSDNIANCQISSITSYRIDAGSAYPHTALLAVRAEDASQLGNQVPIVSARVKGIKLVLPTAYDPITRTHTEPWNGSFKNIAGQNVFTYSNNLSWVIYNVLSDYHKLTIDGTTTDKFLGIPSSHIDKWSFWDFSKVCDKIIDGKPQFAVNGQFIEKKSSKDFINDLLSIGNAKLVEHGGLIRIIYEKQFDDVSASKLPVITPDMVQDAMLEYTSSDLSDRSCQINVIYSDSTEYNNTKTAIATASELESFLGYTQGHYAKLYGHSVQDVTLQGCDNYSQAKRKARWLLWNALQTTEFVGFSMIIPFLQEGDYFILDDKKSSGRVLQVNIGTSKVELVLDQALATNESSVTIYDDQGNIMLCPITSHSLVTAPASPMSAIQASVSSIIIDKPARFPAKATTYSFPSSVKSIYRVISHTKDESTNIFTYTATRHHPQLQQFLDAPLSPLPTSQHFISNTPSTPIAVISTHPYPNPNNATLTIAPYPQPTRLPVMYDIYITHPNSQSTHLHTPTRTHTFPSSLHHVTLCAVVDGVSSEYVTVYA